MGIVRGVNYRTDYRRFCEILRDFREEGGIRQSELAARLGVPQSFVSKYETGERRVDVVETDAIARALGVTLEDIVERYATGRVAADTDAPEGAEGH